MISSLEREIRETHEARKVLESKFQSAIFEIGRHENSSKQKESTIQSLQRELE